MKVITIISNIKDPWGGSEELWYRTIPKFISKGFKVHFIRSNPTKNHPKLIELKTLGVKIHKLSNFKPPIIWRIISPLLSGDVDGEQFQLSLLLKKIKPDFVIVSQGLNFDGLHLAKVCMDFKIPYATIAHKAADINWPNLFVRKFASQVQSLAEKSFFVSISTLSLTERQLGMQIHNAEVIRNPVSLYPFPVPYPSNTNELKLLCLGRIFFLDKGQDMLLAVLALPKWKARSIKVTIMGSGPNEDSLKQLIGLYKISQVEFLSFSKVDASIWMDYHALILPSRFEGMPLAALEAMAAGRACIATNAGGLDEIIEDSKNGFLCEPTIRSIDELLERTWEQRNNLFEMGLASFNKIIHLYETSAEDDFYKKIIKLLK